MAASTSPGRARLNHPSVAVPKKRMQDRRDSVTMQQQSVESRSKTSWCLHLGLPKAASTTLQQRFFSQHSEIAYVGKLFGNCPINSCHEAGVLMHDLLRRCGKKTFTEQQTDEIRCRLHRVLEPSLAENKIAVWSAENLAATSRSGRSQATLLRKIFGQAKVLLFVRHPLTFAVSRYFEELKRVNHGKRDSSKLSSAEAQRLSTRAAVVEQKWGPAPVYFDINTWFAQAVGRRAGPGLNVLQYANTANLYSTLFGREAVKVVLFEQFAEDPQRVIRQVCEFIGIDAEQGARLIRQQHANARWNNCQIERLKRIAGSHWRSYWYRHVSLKSRRKMLGLNEYGQPIQTNEPKASAELSPAWQHWLCEYTKDQNRQLLEEWKLPVDQYGYPL